jgi:hypothetical protein
MMHAYIATYYCKDHIVTEFSIVLTLTASGGHCDAVVE